LRLFQQSLVVRTDGGVNRKLFHDFTLTFSGSFPVRSAVLYLLKVECM